MEAIYAIDINGGLSKDSIIPWNSKKDMKFFMNKTINNVVIMGKNTYFSLPDNVRPLKNRLNIVLTSNPDHLINEKLDSNVVFTNYEKTYYALNSNRDKIIKTHTYLNKNFKIFFIGGKKIYEQFIPLCDKVWVTQIKKDYFCDLFLHYDFSNEFKEPQIIDEDHELKICLYEKKIFN
jgi:dihydrofolate reductase